MRAKKLITLVPILCLLCAICNVAFAAPVYIDVLADFPAYPYNKTAYANPAGDLIGCGPTSGAMFLGYFEHHFGATGLLKNPVAGVTEGLDTAWELHSQSYMKVYTAADEAADPTKRNGFSSVYNIKPGLEGYASDRGHEIHVMAHAPTWHDPATSWFNSYGAYGDAWTNDGDFWVDLGGDMWDIDPDKFCDFVGPKLSAGIGIFLTVDSDAAEEGGDHWIPCVGCDKDADIYYYYDTYDTPLLNTAIISADATPAAGDWAITFVRTVTYVGPIAPPLMTIESCDVGGTKKDTFQLSDEVYATGTGFQPSTAYDIFLVEDVTWVDGMAIPPRVLGTTAAITADGAGNVPATLMWDDPLVPGKYDIVVDVDGDGSYYSEADALDDNDIEVTAGFFVPVVPLTIESCDSTGTKKDTFMLSDEVYATGTGFQPSTAYDIFLVEDVTWVDGMAIPPRVLGTTAAITADGAGNVPATLMWDDPLVPGKYDIVVDVDGDGLYYSEADALDDNDIEVTAGLLIIPEVALGTIAVLAAMVLALVIYAVVPKWKRK